MNRLIILAAITMMSYGKTQYCIGTYNVADRTAIKKQYNNPINCSTDNCNKAHVMQFTKTATTVINTLPNILNNAEFTVDHMVSFNDRSVY